MILGIFLDPMVLEKLGNLTDPISPAECDDRIIFIESEELFVNRCQRTNAALSYPNQLQREEICKAYTQDQQRMRENKSVGVLNPSLCDFQSRVSPLSRKIELNRKLRKWTRTNQNQNLRNIHFTAACRDG